MAMGRPTSNPKPHKITARLNDASNAGIENFCEMENMTKSEALQAITLPLVNYEICPSALLDKLDEALTMCSNVSKDYRENRKKFDLLKERLKPVMAIREKALSFPDIDISGLEPGTTVKQVFLDARAEKLINKTLKLQEALLDRLYGENEKQ